MKLTRKLGMLLLAIWLIVSGLTVLAPQLNSSTFQAALAILAIAAGVLIALER
jgi:hypothetical protein